MGSHRGQAHTWDSLGYVHHHLGQREHAIACYQRALSLYRDLGERYYEAATLARLGEAHHADGHPELGRAACQEALTMLDQLGHPDADRVREKLHRLGLRPSLVVPTQTRAIP